MMLCARNKQNHYGKYYTAHAHAHAYAYAYAFGNRMLSSSSKATQIYGRNANGGDKFQLRRLQEVQLLTGTGASIPPSPSCCRSTNRYWSSSHGCIDSSRSSCRSRSRGNLLAIAKANTIIFTSTKSCNRFHCCDDVNTPLHKVVCYRFLQSSSNSNSNKKSVGNSSNINDNKSIVADLQHLEQHTNEMLNFISNKKSSSSSNNYSSKSSPPTLIHFHQVMESWSQQHNLHGAQRAEELLVALEQNYDQIKFSLHGNGNKNKNDGHSDDGNNNNIYNTYLVPDSISYNHVLQAYAQCNGGEHAALKAEEILHRMMERRQGRAQGHLHNESKTLPPPPEPILSTFHTVMNAWSKSHVIHAGQKAEQIYTMIELEHYDSNDEYNPNLGLSQSLRPNAQSLAIVFDAWANSANEEAVDRILTTLYHIVEKLRQYHDNSSEDKSSTMNNSSINIHLNKIVFHSALLALANVKEGGIDIAMKAEEVFNLLVNLHESDSFFDANANSYDDQAHYMNDTMNPSIDGITKNHDIALAIPTSIDDDDLRPNTRTWSLLLRCWTNAVNHSDQDGGESIANHAESILYQMEEHYKNGEDVKPNSYSYMSCIQAWSKCKSESGALRAMKILKRKEKMYKETDDDDLKPSVFEYNACLAALCAIDDEKLLDEARSLLSRMEKIGVVDTTSFNTMMSAYMKERNADSHLHIWRLFEEMKRYQIHLDTISYNTVMDTVGRKRDRYSIDKIIQMLETMIKHSQDGDSNSDHAKPDVRSFTIVLNAIAKSQLNEKAEPARKVFLQLINLYENSTNEFIVPDVTAFGAFMSCCANQMGPDDRKRYALKLVLGTYEQLCKEPKFGQPNEYIYGSLIKACGRLCQDKDEKSRLIETLFTNCKNEGKVSRAVLAGLLKSCPQKLRNDLLKDCLKLDVDSTKKRSRVDELSFSVPAHWCSNVLNRNQPKTFHSQH